jgi:predicted SAM-dependent methyltransferase
MVKRVLSFNYRAVLVHYLHTRRRLKQSYMIADYVKKHRIRKLQIGTGPNLLEGWLNTDMHPENKGVVFLDARKIFPIGDGVFDYVFSEHQIEHLSFGQGIFMLREINRILKPNGRIRIATPNLQTLIRLYSARRKSRLQKKYIDWLFDSSLILPEMTGYDRSACFVINNAFRNWGHQFLYDPGTMRKVMTKAGFVSIRSYLPGESDDAVFRNVESHARAVKGDKKIDKFETMVFEGLRTAQDHPPG